MSSSRAHARELLNNELGKEIEHMRPLEWLRREHGDLTPVGHALRWRYADRWTRFHSLPESKRYPDTKEEMELLVLRHLAVADTLFTEGEVIYVFVSRLLPDGGIIKLRRPNWLKTSDAPHATRANPGEIEFDDDDRYVTWTKEDQWKPMIFDKIVRLIANEKERNVCFASPGTGNILCPYDGGMDVFTSHSAFQTALVRFDDWRSSRLDGL